MTTFGPSVGDDVAFDVTSLASGAGRISARHDFGAGFKPAEYEWRAFTKLATQGVIGQSIQAKLVTSDGTTEDGNLGTVDAAVSNIDKLENLKHVGRIVVDDDNATPQPLNTSGSAIILSRYVSVFWWNATDDALSTTDGDHQFELIKVADIIP